MCPFERQLTVTNLWVGDDMLSKLSPFAYFHGVFLLWFLLLTLIYIVQQDDMTAPSVGLSRAKSGVFHPDRDDECLLGVGILGYPHVITAFTLMVIGYTLNGRKVTEEEQ